MGSRDGARRPGLSDRALRRSIRRPGFGRDGMFEEGQLSCRRTAGGARPSSGTAGRIENRRIGVFLGYASRTGRVRTSYATRPKGEKRQRDANKLAIIVDRRFSSASWSRGFGPTTDGSPDGFSPLNNGVVRGLLNGPDQRMGSHNHLSTKSLTHASTVALRRTFGDFLVVISRRRQSYA